MIRFALKSMIKKEKYINHTERTYSVF